MTPQQHELVGKFVLSAFCIAAPVSIAASMHGLHEGHMGEALAGGLASTFWSLAFWVGKAIMGDEETEKINRLENYCKPQGKFLLGL